MTTDNGNTPNSDDPEMAAAALDALKERATLLGIQFHSTVGYETLMNKVNAKLVEQLEQRPQGEQDTVTDALNDDDEGSPATAEPVVETASQMRVRMRQEQLALQRVRITCMNPLKAKWTCEIFTVGNRLLGTIKRTVPFNEIWHVETMLLEMIKDRKYRYSVEKTDPITRRKYKESRLASEFAIEYLAPLTEQELRALAQRQAMAAGTAE